MAKIGRKNENKSRIGINCFSLYTRSALRRRARVRGLAPDFVCNMTKQRTKSNKSLWVMLGGALLLRLVLALVTDGYPYDMSCFVAWGDKLAAEGKISTTHKLIVTLEENVSSGGFGRAVCQYINDKELHNYVLDISLPDDYIEHGSVDILRRETGIDEDTIVKRIIAVYNNIGDNNNEQ